MPDYTKKEVHHAILLEALREVKKSKKTLKVGICVMVESTIYKRCPLIPIDDLFVLRFDLRNIMKRWPEYSGISCFPVSHPVVGAQGAYKNFPLWDRRTEYGRARHRLLDFCIEYLEKENVR